MIHFSPHMEILPPAQQRLWRELSGAPRLGLVLYGGTAIALRVGHRPSIDFDFFTNRPLDRKAIDAAFPFLARATVLQERPDTLEVLVPCGESSEQHVKVSFFWAITVGRVGAPGMTEDGVLQVASLDDLMATKVKVLLQRVEAKDYKDIAALIGAGASLSRGLAAARAMWGERFQPSESLKALVYFEGGDLHTLTNNEKDVLISAASAVRDLPHITVISHDLSVPSINCAHEDDQNNGLGLSQ